LRDDTTVRLRSDVARGRLTMKTWSTSAGWWERLFAPAVTIA
jgi:hypothetical protein